MSADVPTGLRAGEEGLEQVVVRRAGGRDRVRAAADDLAPRADALGDDVAHRLEGGRVVARDDELAEPRRRERVEGQLGLPRRALVLGVAGGARRGRGGRRGGGGGGGGGGRGGGGGD